MDELTPEETEVPDNNCYFDVAETEALISCMDKAVKQASDSIGAAISLFEIRKKLEKIARPGGPD